MKSNELVDQKWSLIPYMIWIWRSDTTYDVFIGVGVLLDFYERRKFIGVGVLMDFYERRKK